MSQSPFKFQLKQRVRIELSDELGQVVARSESVHSNPQYLVRFLGNDGRAGESWWAEDALQAYPTIAEWLDPSDGEPVRKITSHAVNETNEAIQIVVSDVPGSGGANHRYDVFGFNLQRNPSRLADDPSHLVLLFQNGPIAEAGVNGITHEVLLAIVADRLECFQRGAFANDYNAAALEAVKAAQDALQARTRERMARGVEGTHTV